MLSCIALIACLAVGRPDPPLGIFPNFECVSGKTCRGLAGGNCVAQGIDCDPLPGDCTPANQGTCYWHYLFECQGPSVKTCVAFYGNILDTDCGPECQLLTFNQCACRCTDLGVGTSEGTSSIYQCY